MDDKEFLQWIYNRLVEVHGESPQRDYMHRLRAIADVQDRHTPNVPRVTIEDVRMLRNLTGD